MLYTIFIDSEKLPYLNDMGIKYEVLGHSDSRNIKIEVLISDGADLIQFLYAGVQYGIAVAYQNIKAA